MTEPPVNSAPPIPATATDPITAILLAVTRMEGNLANVLNTVTRHDGEIGKQGEQIANHGNRITALETRALNEDEHSRRGISSRAALWTAVAAVAALIGVLLTYIIKLHGG